MGCACFRSNVIINSKIKENENENNDEYDINNIITNHNEIINNNNQNNMNMMNSDNLMSNSSNNIRINSSNNYDSSNFMHVDNKLQIEHLTGIKVLSTASKSEKAGKKYGKCCHCNVGFGRNGYCRCVRH